MDAKLVIVGGKASKSHVSVRLPAVIGRSREADLTVAHPMVSRKHCQLYEVDGLVMVRDLGSLNGTFVEHKQISEAALHPDGEFTVGPLTFRIEYEYLGDITPPEEVGVAAEGSPQPEGELASEVTDFELGEPAPAVGPGSADVDETFPLDEEPPSDAQPDIAPPDGQLPDFSAWEADAPPAGQAQTSGRPAPSSSPPDDAEALAPDAEQPPAVDQEEAHLAETLELAPSQRPHGAKADVAGADRPPPTTDGPEEESEEEAEPEPSGDEPSAAFAPEADDAEAAPVDLEESGQEQTSDEMPDSTGAAESESGTTAAERLSDDEELDKFLKGFE